MDIFVGSLSFKVKEGELREVFEKYGEVTSVKIIIDKITRQSKGFAFIEMPNEEHGKFAISQLNGADMYGRPLVVNESQKRDAPPRPRNQESTFRRTSDNDRYSPAKKPDTPRDGNNFEARPFKKQPESGDAFEAEEDDAPSGGIIGDFPFKPERSKFRNADRAKDKPSNKKPFQKKSGSSNKPAVRKFRKGDDGW